MACSAKKFPVQTGSLRRLLAVLSAWVLSAWFFGVAAAYAQPAAAPSADLAVAAPAVELEHTPRVARETAQLPDVPHEFVRVEVGGFLTLKYPRGAEPRIEPIVSGAAEFKSKLIEILGTPVLDHIEVRIGKDPEEMASLAPIGVPPLRYASGISYRGIGLILISLKAPKTFLAVNVEETFRHELVHQALDDAAHGHHVPAWFHEGLAVNLSGESALERKETLANAVFSKSILPLAQLDAQMPNQDADYTVSVAYAQSADFLRFLLKQGDSARFSALIGRVGRGQEFPRALADAYGTDMRKLEYQWTQSLADRFPLWLALGTGGVFWTFGILALAIGYVRKSRAKKLTLARWEKDEERLAHARLRALEQHAMASTTAGEFSAVMQSAVPRLQHEGEWHTLH